MVNGFGGYQSAEYVERAGVVGTFPSVVANARLRVLRVPYVVIHLDAYSERAAATQALERAARYGEIELVAHEGSDRLYRVRPAKPTRVTALLHGLEWSDVTLAWPGPDTALRQAVSLGATFALRSPDQFVVYMEDTTPNSRLVLDVPVPMTGEFLDAGSWGGAEGGVVAERPERVSRGCGRASWPRSGGARAARALTLGTHVAARLVRGVALYLLAASSLSLLSISLDRVLKTDTGLMVKVAGGVPRLVRQVTLDVLRLDALGLEGGERRPGPRPVGDGPLVRCVARISGRRVRSLRGSQPGKLRSDGS